MRTEPASGGGIDLHRAMEHERAATIFHLLVRWQQHSDAVVTIESFEDATIVYSSGAMDEVIEDIQCKKVEDGAQNKKLIGMDDWWPAPLTRGLLKDWLEQSRRGESSIDRLAAASNRYLTLLAFAEPSKSLIKYVPPGVIAAGWTRHPATTDYFSIDYMRPDDPDPYSGLGNSQVRQKIRIVPLGPPQLRTFSAIIFHKIYGVASARTPDALHAIENLLYGHMGRDPAKRTFGLVDIETAIKAFHSGQGKWMDVRGIIELEQRHVPDAISRNVPVVAWTDFASSRYIKTEMLGVGAKALRAQKFIVISGNNGSGKTALCKYLAHIYLASNAVVQCFYLQVRSGDDLRDEVDFFLKNLARPALFIIDDEQFAEKEVNAIAQEFIDLQPTKVLQAKLVIATTNTSYSQAQREGRDNALDAAHHLKFDFLSSQAMRQYLISYQEYRPLDHNISGIDIADVAGGDRGRVNMGLALVLAHSVNPQEFSVSRYRSVQSPAVRAAIAEWLASVLDLTPQEVTEHIVPIFMICSYGLSIRLHFSEYVARMKSVGFLEESSGGDASLLSLRADYYSLAILHQNYEHQAEAFRRYAELHPDQTPQLAHALSRESSGRSAFTYLLDNHPDLFSFVFSDRDMNLSGAAMIMLAARRVGRKASSALVRRWFKQGERRESRAIVLRVAIYSAMSIDVRPITDFFGALYSADEVLAENIGAMLIEDPADFHRFLTLLRSSPSDLYQTVRFLNAAKKCHLRFGTNMTDQYGNTPEYEEKWQRIVNTDSPVLLVRLLRELQGLNRRLFIAGRDKYLGEPTLLAWIDKVQDIRSFIELLTQLRVVRPKAASRALVYLKTRHGAMLSALVSTTASITDSTSIITNIARVDRRVAINLAREGFEKLVEQIQVEPHYNNTATSLGRIQRRAAANLAEKLAMHTPAIRVAESMQQERKRFELIGRSLLQLADVSSQLAVDIAGRINYQELYARVTELPLLNYARLTQGLHITLSESEKPKLISYIRDTPDLTAAFHDSLYREKSLNQVADAISTMAAAGLTVAEVFRLFGTDEPGFRHFIRQCMSGRGDRPFSDVEVANFLFAVASLDPAYATEALMAYVNASGFVDGDSNGMCPPKGAAVEGGNSARAVEKRLDRRFGDPKSLHYAPRIDLAGSGALFQMSAAIDDDIAKMLLRVRMPGSFGAMADKNMGRHSTFLLGLHNVSRAACLKFIREVYTPKRLETLFDAAQNPRELIQFLHAIQIISVGEGRRIGSGLIAEDGDSLRDYLEAEVDLSEVSRWTNTLVAIGQSQSQDLGGLARECANYDTRLWALIDATQAMIVAGLLDDAAHLAATIPECIRQIRGVRKLSHCVQLWLKMKYISLSLSQPQMIVQLTEELLPHAIDLIPLENDYLCAAFAVSLWLDCGLVSQAQMDRLEGYRAYLLKRSHLVDPMTVRPVLAASLLRSPDDQMAVLLRRLVLDSNPTWMLGLLQLVADAYLGGRHSVPLRVTASLDLDQNNLKYGLSYYAQQRQHGSVSDVESNELAVRNADEGSAAVRHLLNPDFSPASLLTKPYYVWVYLKRTALTLSYLEWEREIQRANRAAIFGRRSSPDPESMLHAAE